MWTMSDYRGRARQTAIAQRSTEPVQQDMLSPAASDSTDAPDEGLLYAHRTQARAAAKPSRGLAVGSSPNISREAAAFELCRRTDGHSRPLVGMPSNLLERMKDFPKLDGFYEYTPLGQANILILQLAERIHALEQRVMFLENERSAQGAAGDEPMTDDVKIDGGPPTP